MNNLWRLSSYSILALAVLSVGVAEFLAIFRPSSLISNAETRTVHTPADIGLITVYPTGKSLPTSFLNQPWTSRSQDMLAMRCGPSCDALMSDLDGDGKDDIMLIGVREGRPVNEQIFRQAQNGHWILDAVLNGWLCADDLTALRNGKAKFVPSDRSDIMVGERRVRMTWMYQPEGYAPCPRK